MSNYFGSSGKSMFTHSKSLFLFVLVGQHVEEIKEIWNFGNIVLWLIEYCLLSYNISFGLVSGRILLIPLVKNELVVLYFQSLLLRLFKISIALRLVYFLL